MMMSHDLLNWKAQVLKEYPDIDLMLAGHTHGMQFGLEILGFKWSPVQYVYKEWAGLYEIDGQRLYVNRGFGFIGYPGWSGILPEITVLGAQLVDFFNTLRPNIYPNCFVFSMSITGY